MSKKVTMEKGHYSFIVKAGNRLFLFRRWFYSIPILIMLLNTRNLYYPFDSHFYDEVFEITGLVIALAGAAVRFLASGSSGRAVIKKGKEMRFHLHAEGIFSVVRNPYFLGDALIVSGLSLPLINPVLMALSLGIFLLFYLPVHFAREEMLLRFLGDDYRQYCSRVPPVIPALNRWKPGKKRFRWWLALRKEANVLMLVCIFFFFIEQFRDLQIDQSLDKNPFWIVLFFAFFAFFLIARILEGFLEDLPNVPHSMDSD